MSTSRSQSGRRVVLLDLDENLILVKRQENQKSPLSSSAELSLCHETELTEVKIHPEKTVLSVKAICRLEWITFFNNVIEVNRLYRSIIPEDPHLLVIIGFLTGSETGPAEFSHIFGQLFISPEDMTDLVPAANFERFYFNMRDIMRVCPPGKISKGLFMDIKYENWSAVLDGLTRLNTSLVDDSMFNCRDANNHGFLAIHNPTNEKGRSPGTLFSNHKSRVFMALNNIVEAARAHCKELQAQKNTPNTPK